jgi:hypothetical protein
MDDREDLELAVGKSGDSQPVQRALGVRQALPGTLTLVGCLAGSADGALEAGMAGQVEGTEPVAVEDSQGTAGLERGGEACDDGSRVAHRIGREHSGGPNGIIGARRSGQV